MIKYVKGDLFLAPQTIIAHGCNCKGGFGSGVAKTMSQKHPEARSQYLRKFNSVGWKLGDIQYVKSNGKVIANCATQYDYGSPKGGAVYVDYDSIKTCMEKLKKVCVENKLSVAIPKIGAGLAGGDWDIIEKIINEVFFDLDIYVYVI
jgi:O-acetyl-ADP-ribose deacetylase (regulator of RNase III)